MIEIIARETCPTCNGTGKWEQQTVLGPIIGPCHMCDEETRTVPRVLATFADAAALRPILQDVLDRAHDANKQAWEDFLTEEQLESMVSAVLAALGVSDDTR